MAVAAETAANVDSEEMLLIMAGPCMGSDLWQARPPGPLIVSHARANPAPNHCLASASRLQALKRVAQWKKEKKEKKKHLPSHPFPTLIRLLYR